VSSSLMGNSFKGPLPSWIPAAENDYIMYISPDRRIHQAMIFTLGLAVFFLTCLMVLGWKAPCFVVPLLHSSADHQDPCPQYFVIASAVLKLTAFCMMGMLPFYMLGSHFYQCVEMLPNYSHLGNSPLAEWLSGDAVDGWMGGHLDCVLGSINPVYNHELSTAGKHSRRKIPEATLLFSSPPLNGNSGGFATVLCSAPIYSLVWKLEWPDACSVDTMVSAFELLGLATAHDASDA